jgi:IclR family acetate operon transcriptional repressor
LPEVAQAVGLPKSSIFRYLSTLEARGYVQRDPGNGHFRAGRAFHLAPAGELVALAARARPLLDGLRDRFGETINLGVLDGRRVAYLEIVESPRAIRFAARKGDRDPVHSTALGKAITSRLPEHQVRRILAEEGMPQRTSRTITDPRSFLEELAEVRRRGYALDNGENEEDGRCVAVPVPDRWLPAAVSLSAPAARFSLSGVGTVVEALRAVARELPSRRGDGDA